MKKLLALSLLLVSCSQEDQSKRSEVVAQLDFVGKCTDLEVPSKYKPIDTYEVEAKLSIYKTDSKYNTGGFISTTSDDLIKRIQERGEVSEYENIDEWFAVIDNPSISIPDFPSNLLNETEWNVSAIHNYTEDNSIYGERAAECSLTLESKTGIIPEELFEKDRLCFSFGSCLFRGNADDPLGIR